MDWGFQDRRLSWRGAAAAATLLFAATTAAAKPAEPFYTGSLPPERSLEAKPSDAPPEQPTGHLLVLGFAGDLGFSGSGDTPSSQGAVKHGALIPWSRLTGSIAPLLSADANFANLETVIAASRTLTPIEKAYNFLGDPAGIGVAVAMGITVLTAANNHAGDFGADGIVETLSYLAAATESGLKAYAGLGMGAERYRASVFQLGQTSVGVAAIGLGFNHAGAGGPGQPLYASAQDFDRVLTALAETDAEVRVLSVHYGQELASLPGPRDTGRFRRAVDSGAAHIVFGHHSHVASGVAYRHGGVILYGLGNFMHSGTQDMSRYGACRDFGLYAKVYLWATPGHVPFIRAVEVFPIRDMHAVPQALTAIAAARRVTILNAMNVAVAGEGTSPVHFEPTSHASGLACFGEQSAYGDDLSSRCRAISGPRQVSAVTDRSFLATCGTSPAPSVPAQVVVEQPPTQLPIPRTVPRKPAKAAAVEKPKTKNFLQKLFD